jgi:tripartite-type tricarboxylate transporter receptor subunit TctC
MAQDWPNKPIRMVIDRLNSEINRILVTPAVTQIICGRGAELTPMTPAQLAALNAADTLRFAAIIKQQGGIRPNQ